LNFRCGFILIALKIDIKFMTIFTKIKKFCLLSLSLFYSFNTIWDVSLGRILVEFSTAARALFSFILVLDRNCLRAFTLLVRFETLSEHLALLFPFWHFFCLWFRDCILGTFYSQIFRLIINYIDLKGLSFSLKYFLTNFNVFL
jgi:hypothetical protein